MFCWRCRRFYFIIIIISNQSFIDQITRLSFFVHWLICPLVHIICFGVAGPSRTCWKSNFVLLLSSSSACDSPASSAWPPKTNRVSAENADIRSLNLFYFSPGEILFLVLCQKWKTVWKLVTLRQNGSKHACSLQTDQHIAWSSSVPRQGKYTFTKREEKRKSSL